MIEGILIGLQTALSLKNLMMVMIGCFAGTIIGMLPGFCLLYTSDAADE